MANVDSREFDTNDTFRRQEAEYLKQADCCDHCEVPRRLAALVYEQDLVSHCISETGNRVASTQRSLEALCRRCWEIETLGRSDLREIRPYGYCDHCRRPVWDFACSHGIEGLCADCTLMLWGLSPRAITSPRLAPNGVGGLEPDVEFWKYVTRQIVSMMHPDDVRRVVEVTLDCVERNDPGAWALAMREIPSRERRREKREHEESGPELPATPKPTVH